MIDELINLATSELKSAEEAFEATNSLATEGDVKQESKYDTRGIEAGYLAGAQKKRVEELKLDIHRLEEMKNLDLAPQSEIILGSIVTIDFGGGERTYFVTSSFGGVQLKVGGQLVHVITTASPIGEEMLGLSAGDEFELDPKKVYSVLKIN